ncbi:hypothetical protein FA95DRAFT_1554789 [Auriscalpium vulgare]|uniref:Uncharacterized protein n=1 Tax=Auriscalpium vulgare TaxID=40419 RepID=A0ACB8S4X5_9AGAM|nr:hypothetical protein FA95DRAFT_1554789 [Auriscalpium vulgare]
MARTTFTFPVFQDAPGRYRMTVNLGSVTMPSGSSIDINFGNGRVTVSTEGEPTVNGAGSARYGVHMQTETEAEARERMRWEEGMRRAREAEQQRAREQKERRRRHEQARFERDLSLAITVRAWKDYQAGWARLLFAPVLTFEDIPWPLVDAPQSAADIHAGSVEEFLLSPAHSTGIAHKERLRIALLRWHPDKFARVLARVAEEDREFVKEGAEVVARHLSLFLERENARGQH